ncbi:MAG: molybdenum cofactor guanylyltransferase [Acidobacteriia bacterium]|nr:molybdenum cofactor guanylyltransferase [Terriglobia bacterium]
MANNLSAFVLAGGKSTRMGTDKAALELDGRTLLEHALATLRSVAGDVCVDICILGSRQLYKDYGVEVIEDLFPGCGPLGGIHAALALARAPLNLIIAVDTPFLSPEFLRRLVQRAAESCAVVTAPEIAGYRQPLCAVYSLDFLPIAEQALRSGNYKIVPLFPEGKTLVITEEQMAVAQAADAKSADTKPARFAFNAGMFDNLNTPQDLERARRKNKD